MAKAPIVLVVSLPKTGTHLIGELMKLFGYKVYGPSGPGGFGEPLPPELEEKLSSNLAAVPPDTCIVLHHLGLPEVVDDLAVTWKKTGVPAVIFNYRDPRDVCCSWVRFLRGDTYSKSFGITAAQLVHSEIIQSLGDHDEQLMYAICDPQFPACQSFESATWLLRHPRVCNVAFERLIGAEGGGDEELQVKQVAEIMRHVGVMGDPKKYAEKIFRRDTPTFSRGQIGSWRKEFRPEHLDAFNEHFGELLETYGYERFESPEVLEASPVA